MIERCLVFLALCAIANSASAEGGTCPPGYYPHNSPGVMGCAPIPGYAIPTGGSPATQQPSLRWDERWGAIATDPDAGTVGTVSAQRSRRAAELGAIERCGSKGCKVLVAYANQCAALAWRPGTQAFGTDPNAEIAEKRALESCGDGNALACKVIYAECSLAEEVR
ncbi:DUF4189 domain-containing protein [Pseudoxanthomonas wuyuanensis]